MDHQWKTLCHMDRGQRGHFGIIKRAFLPNDSALRASQNEKMFMGLGQKREQRSVGPKKKKAVVSALQVFLYKTIIPYLSEKSNPFFSRVSKKSQGYYPGSA